MPSFPKACPSESPSLVSSSLDRSCQVSPRCSFCTSGGRRCAKKSAVWPAKSSMNPSANALEILYYGNMMSCVSLKFRIGLPAFVMLC